MVAFCTCVASDVRHLDCPVHGDGARRDAELRRRTEDATAVPDGFERLANHPCPTCRGTGGGEWNDCPTCDGNGVI